jgi:hypothetical protein
MFAHANALCSKNNLNIAKELSEVVNWRQTIQSPKKKDKTTSNGPKRTQQNTRYWTTWTLLNTWSKLRWSRRVNSTFSTSGDYSFSKSCYKSYSVTSHERGKKDSIWLWIRNICCHLWRLAKSWWVTTVKLSRWWF